MPKTKLLDIVDVLETYADLYDMFDDNRLVYEALDKVNEELRAIPSVKAIPIEWINSYTTGLIFSDDYVDNADSIDDYIYCIKEMVRDWEKENEID